MKKIKALIEKVLERRKALMLKYEFFMFFFMAVNGALTLFVAITSVMWIISLLEGIALQAFEIFLVFGVIAAAIFAAFVVGTVVEAVLEKFSK